MFLTFGLYRPVLCLQLQASTGKTSCDLCPAGYYSGNDFASSCMKCVTGTYSNNPAKPVGCQMCEKVRAE